MLKDVQQDNSVGRGKKQDILVIAIVRRVNKI